MTLKQIKATYQVVTPLFLGDGEQRFTGLRAPSIKGALRFWWRALNWEPLRQQTGSDEKALHLLHGAESWLFGNAAGIYPASKKGSVIGQSRVLLTVRQPVDWETFIEDGWPTQPKSRQNIDGASYMGFGLFEMRRKNGKITNTQRQALREGVTFGMDLTFKPDLSTGRQDYWPEVLGDPVENVRKALVWWGLIGGLGGRARRGFGSVALRTLECDGQVQEYTYDSPETYEHAVAETLRYFSRTDLPPYTALSGETKFALLTGTTDNPRQVLGEAGKKYKLYRDTLARRDRVPFGLPLAKVNTNDRRAGPLFFHVHPVGRGFDSAVLFVPALFHLKYPSGNQITFYMNVQSFLKGKKKG